MNFVGYLNKILENVLIGKGFQGGVKFELPKPNFGIQAPSIFSLDGEKKTESMKLEDFNDSVYSNILHFETNLEESKAKNNEELDEDKKLNDVEFALNRLIDIPSIKEKVAGEDGEISIDELKAYIAELAGKDGEADSLSMSDIEAIVKDMNVDLEELLKTEEEEAVKKEEEANNASEANPEDKTQEQGRVSEQPASNGGNQPVSNQAGGSQTADGSTPARSNDAPSSVGDSSPATPVRGGDNVAPAETAKPAQTAAPAKPVAPAAPAKSQAEVKLEQLKAKQPQLEQTLATKKQELEAAKTASDQKIQQTKADMEQKKAALDKAMEKETPEVKAAVQAVTDATENIAKTEEDLGKQKAEVGDKSEQITSANAKLSQRMDSLATQMSNLSALKSRNLSPEDEGYANWQSQISQAEAQVSQGKQEVAQMKAEIAELEAQKQVAEAEVARLEELLETHKQAKQEAEDALNKLKEQMSDAAKAALQAYEKASKAHVDAQSEKTKNISTASAAVEKAAAAVQNNKAEIVAAEKELNAEKAKQLAELEKLEAAQVDTDGNVYYPHEGQTMPEGKMSKVDLIKKQHAQKVKQENVNNIKYGKLYHKYLPGDMAQKLDAMDASGAKFEVSLDKNNQYTLQINESQDMKSQNLCKVIEKYSDEGAITSAQNSYRDGKATLSTYSADGTFTTKVLSEPAPESLQNVVSSYGSKYGGDSYVEYNVDTGKYEMVQKNMTNLPDVAEIRTELNEKAWQENMSTKEALSKGLNEAWDSFEVVRDNVGLFGKASDAFMDNMESSITNEDYFSKQIITYASGQVNQVLYEEGNMTQNTILAQPLSASPKAEQGQRLHTPVPISFDMPEDAPQAAKDFAQSLCDNKARLMAELHLDNDEYNKFAQAAIAIAGQETNFGETTFRSLGKDYIRYQDESLNSVASFVAGEDVDISGKDWSRGMTQLKFSLHTADLENGEPNPVKLNMDALGITDEAQLDDPAISAMATVVVLSHMDKWAQDSKYQNGIEAAQGIPVRYNNWSMGENGIAVKQEGVTNAWSNKITDVDVLCAFWNGGSKIKEMANGTYKPQSYEYVRNVHTYMGQYKLVEDLTARAAAVEREAETRAFSEMNNNGEIGGIVFMPGMYNNKSVLQNSSADIQRVDQALRSKNVNDSERTQFVSAMQNGEIAFEHGVDQREIDAIQAADVRQMLRHLHQLRVDIAGIDTSDGITASEANLLRAKYDKVVARAEKRFRKEYMNNHSGTVAYKNSPHVLTDWNTYDDSNETFMDANGNRKVFRSANGEINLNTQKGKVSDAEALLAQSSYGVVSQNTANVSHSQCLTGFKSAMSDAGIDVSGMTHYGNTPKMIVNWFEANNDKFTSIDYVDNGNGTARRINASDIKRLPAGYVVVYIPDDDVAEYAVKEGHIGVTTGNGNVNSDFTDNSYWASMAKGEHGTFKVYKLSPGWYVGSDNKLHFDPDRV